MQLRKTKGPRQVQCLVRVSQLLKRPGAQEISMNRMHSLVAGSAELAGGHCLCDKMSTIEMGPSDVMAPPDVEILLNRGQFKVLKQAFSGC